MEDLSAYYTETSSALQIPRYGHAVSDAATDTIETASRPQRADARRNRDKLVSAAPEGFAEHGPAASLDDIARRAEVGIGTLYRHFPTRHALLEAVYLEEVEAICQSAEGLSELDPWDALTTWLRRFVGYAATKRALAEELLAVTGADSEV